MGKFDVPTMVNGILSVNRSSRRIRYAGFDQGATQMFSALAYNYGNLENKIEHFIALGPLVNLAHSTDKFYMALSKTCDTIRDVSLNIKNIDVIGTGKAWQKQQN